MKPMLAGKAPTDLTTLRYPLLVSPKLDGVRAIVQDGQVLSRNLLPIPNPTVQELFGHAKYNGFDGELIVGPPTAPDAFRLTSSFVMSQAHVVGEAKGQLRFHVFDDCSTPSAGFGVRYANLARRVNRAAKHLAIVPHERVVNHHGIDVYEALWLQEGYEGLMIRSSVGHYKYGRSTTNEGLLLKLKRFEDGEAEVVGYHELMHNANEGRTGGLAQRRSSKKEHMVGRSKLGALTVRDLKTGVQFDVGTGFGDDARSSLWLARDSLEGHIIKYKYFAGGVKDKPRFPVFLGFRYPLDL